MSESNGEAILKIGRKGRRRFQIGEGDIVSLDVIDVHNKWCEIDETFRLPDRSIDPVRRGQHLDASLEFVQSIFRGQDISKSEALEFLKVITEEAVRLSDFFKVSSGEGPSSPGPTELTFST